MLSLPAASSERALSWDQTDDFHFHPHYREKTALEQALLDTRREDNFPEEQVQDRLAAVLKGWSGSLLLSPANSGSIETALSSEFLGASPQPLEAQPLRPPVSGLTCDQIRFSPDPTLKAKDFVDQLKSSWRHLLKIRTAEFQVTRIDSSKTGATTSIRYELVGEGEGFFREQRIGNWILEWTRNSEDQYHVVRWRFRDEVRSHARERLFSEITSSAFGHNSSYHEQITHGADYWRTILDGASGIDIYGHNGVSVGDVDGDGFDDIYVCQPAGIPNRLYLNRRDGTFEDITEASGVGILDNTACALFADFDNDGRQDLIVVRASGPLLFLNQGEGKFKLKPNAFQFATPPQGTFTGAAAADYNRDGRLDVYFCLYTYYQGTDQYKYPTPYFAAENGPPNFLMHNNGDGTFTDVTTQRGLDKNNTRYSFCASWSDYDGDGWPDLFVVNDFGRKNLYRNNGDGTFTDIAGTARTEDVGAGMSVSWLDYDNTGEQDLYIANMWTAAGERITNVKRFQESAAPEIRDLYRKHAMGNSLLKKTGAGFEDATDHSHTAVGRWSWSSDAWDFDHDGFSDLYIANGMISGPIRNDLNSFFWREVVGKSPNTFKSDAEYESGWNAINELIRADNSWSGPERNVLFANNRDGTFCDISGAAGLDFVDDSRSFALADFDGDGRQELILKNRNAPQLRLVKNIAAGLPPSITFRLQGTKSNRDAIGASIRIQTSTGHQTKFIQAGSGFLSQHSKELFFGLGDAKGSISASIRWPSGTVQEFKGLPASHRISVTEGSDIYRSEVFRSSSQLASATELSEGENLPGRGSTWLLVPITAPKFSLEADSAKVSLLVFRNSITPAYDGIWPKGAPAIVEVLVDDAGNEDVSNVYNLLFRYIFDRHRDLPLPTSFLINEKKEIVKVYQGKLNAEIVTVDSKQIPVTDAERTKAALPFPGVTGTYEYGRNYLSLGSIFFQHGYADYAEDFFQSALRQDSLSSEAAYGLGSVYLKQSKNALAQSYFERALKNKATYPETTPNAWNNLGLLATRTGEIAKAISYFQEALQVDPNHFVALENLGSAYRQQKRWPEARTTLELALSIKPNDPEANFSLGMVWAQTNDATKAYQYLTRALQARPVYPEALNNLGILYLRTHRRDEAVTTFEQCIQLSPGFDQSYLNLARVYSIEGNAAKARTVLNALLIQHPDSSAARQALSQLP